MKSHSKTCEILRVRPASSVADGLPKDALEQLVDAVLGHPDGSYSSRNLSFPLNASPFEATLIDRLYRAISDITAKGRVAFVDFCYDRTIDCYKILEWLLYQALRKCVDEAVAGARIFVYLQALPSAGERLSLLLPHLDDQSVVTFLSDQGGMSPAIEGDRAAAVSDFFAMNRSLSYLIERGLIRSRGVFARDTDADRRYYKFDYTFPTYRERRELVESISAYIEEKSIEAIVFIDTSSDGWLEECIAAAGNETGVAWASLAGICADLDDLEPAVSQLVRRTRDRIDDHRSTIAVVTAALHDGRGCERLLSYCRGRGREDLFALTVLMDAERVGGPLADENWYGTVEVAMGTESVLVDYFCAAPIVELASDSALVFAAGEMGEIATVDERMAQPSQVGIWSLVLDYPVMRETPVPAGRTAIPAFPQFGGLSDWDAVWIAHLMIEQLLAELHVQKSQVLVVIPDEPNGSRKLAWAFEDRLGVAVAKVSRAALERREAINSKVADKVRDFKAFRIVAVDESSVTGRTIRDIERVVVELLGPGRKCDASMVALSAVVGGAADPVPALFRWVPYSWDGLG